MLLGALGLGVQRLGLRVRQQRYSSSGFLGMGRGRGGWLKFKEVNVGMFRLYWGLLGFKACFGCVNVFMLILGLG